MPRRPKDKAKTPRHPVQARVTPDLLEKIVAAAAASGRSIAHEVERRLETSFELNEDMSSLVKRSVREALAEFEPVKPQIW